MIRILYSGLLIILLFFHHGCDRSVHPHDFPQLYPTVITVTQEGKPLENALVSLYSTDLNFKWSVAAVSDRNGKATIRTHGKFPGAPVGEYKIVVTKTEPSNKDLLKSNSDDNPETHVVMSKITLFSFIEKQYTDIATTPLTIVIEQGKNIRNFDLGKAVYEKTQTVEF